MGGGRESKMIKMVEWEQEPTEPTEQVALTKTVLARHIKQSGDDRRI